MMSDNSPHTVWKTPQVIAYGILALGLILAAWGLGDRFKLFKPTHIAVVGSASSTVKSDRAIWSIELNTRLSNESQAYQKLKHDRQTLHAYLTKAGFDPKTDIHWGSVSKTIYYVQTSNGGTTSEVESIGFSQTVNVETSQIPKVQQGAQTINDLIEKGVQLNAMAPRYLYTGLDAIKIDMVGRATKNAKERAEAIAKQTGTHVGGVVEASTGVFQITSPYSTEVSDYGIYDESTVDKKVTAVVNASFTLN
ncbi:MAG: SIMPL domain-containing protein [Vampirovibrionales bacterium]